jgi:hypothetical protein
MSWLSSFLHPEKGYQGAQGQLDKYYNQGQGFQQPYNQNGINQGKTLTDAIQQLMNPSGLRDQWEKNYTTSDAAKNTMNMAQNQGLDAASSMGLLGSSPALQAIQAGTAGIAAEDKQNYLKQMMDMYTKGVDTSGGMYNTGANAAGQMNTNAQNMGSNSAGMKFGEMNAPGDMLSKLLQGITSFMTPVGQAWGMGKLGLNNNPWNTGAH